MNSKALDILHRYLAGTLDLQSASEDISKLGEYSLAFSSADTNSIDRQRIEELFGRVLWLTLREDDPENVPETPFGATEFRAMLNGTFFDATGDESDDENGSGPVGAP